MKKGNLESRIEFRVMKEEREKIREQAEASGLSVSEYVRRRALGCRVSSVTDVRMLSELRRQGGLLKKIFNESNGMYSEKMVIALDSVNKFIESLEEKVLNDYEKTFMSVQ